MHTLQGKSCSGDANSTRLSAIERQMLGRKEERLNRVERFAERNNMQSTCTENIVLLCFSTVSEVHISADEKSILSVSQGMLSVLSLSPSVCLSVALCLCMPPTAGCPVCRNKKGPFWWEPRAVGFLLFKPGGLWLSGSGATRALGQASLPQMLEGEGSIPIWTLDLLL